MTDSALESQYRAATASCPGGGRGCPDADELVALAQGTLEAERYGQVLDRVVACSVCGDGLRLALESGDWARQLAADLAAAQKPATVHVLPRRAAPRLPAFALAASVLLAAGLAFTVGRAPPIDVQRGASVAAVLPLDRAVLAQPPAALSWDCAAPAAAVVEVLDAAGELRWSGSTATCTLELPAATRAALGPGAWLWQVRDAGGRAVLAGPFGFRIE